MSNEVWNTPIAPPEYDTTPPTVASTPVSPSVPIAFDLDRIAGEEPGERDRVDADVEHRAAGEVGAAVASIGVEDRDAEVGLHDLQLADLAVEHPLADLDHRRDEPGPHRFHQEAVVAARGIDHLTRLGGVEREGLLAQHVFAGIERGDRHGMVVAVRRGDVDDVDVGIGEQRLVGAVRVRDLEPCREVVGGVLGA